jgi:hypothetical protein
MSLLMEVANSLSYEIADNLSYNEMLVLLEEVRTAGKKRRAYTSTEESPVENYEMAARIVTEDIPALIMLARIAEKVHRVALWFKKSGSIKDAPLDDLVDISVISRLIAANYIIPLIRQEASDVRS